MTLPYERYWAIENTREFLLSLLDPKETPRVPREIRRQARQCLKHYPWGSHMDKAREECPEVWGRSESASTLE